MSVKQPLCLLTFVLLVCLAVRGGEAQLSDQSDEERPELRAFFAFEKELWTETPGAVLELHPLHRYPGNPVIPRGEGQAPDSHRVSYTSILPEGDKLRAWYQAMPAGGKWTDHAIAYAESEDGIHWIKPSLNLVEPGTNLLLREAFGLSVVPDPTLGPTGYRAGLHFFRPDVRQPGNPPGGTFQMVSSRDGYHWDFDQVAATDIRHFEMFGAYRREGRWWVLGQGVSPYFRFPDGRPHSRVMYGFHSANGRDFELYPRPLFSYPVNPHFPDAGLQNHIGAGIWDRGRVLLGMAGQFWPGGFSQTVHMSVGLIYSHDGLNWLEPFPRTPILGPAATIRLGGDTAAWDRGFILQVQRPVSRGDRTYFYYVGGDAGNEWRAQTAVGLAFLRRDGFAAYSAEAEEANLITIPLRREAGDSTLYLNARGPLSVQVLDALLRPASEEIPVGIDGVRMPVLSLSQVPDRFRLAFKLEGDAALYAFYLGPDESRLPALEAWE
jgi:hypothetical protein